MQPNVTIVLPVYNVEPYLRQCLDSVVNQTMREIQVICVNDGSTDGSLVILEEYAAKDPRIMVIHQENQGGGSARNAAFPHIKGKYTYFVDPDDWIDLHLCEKLFKSAEENQAEIVYLDYCNVNRFVSNSPNTMSIKKLLQCKYLSLFERKKICFGIESTVCKFWNSHFLLKYQITFVTGKRPCNDILQNWKGVIYAKKIEVTDELLYYRRIRPGSYQSNKDSSSKLIVFLVYDEIKELLIQTGFYDQYEEFFLTRKLQTVFGKYVQCPWRIRRKIFEMALENFDEALYDSYRKSSGIHPRFHFCRTVFAKKRNKKFQYVSFSILLFFCTYFYLCVQKIKRKFEFSRKNIVM